MYSKYKSQWTASTGCGRAASSNSLKVSSRSSERASWVQVQHDVHDMLLQSIDVRKPSLRDQKATLWWSFCRMTVSSSVKSSFKLDSYQDLKLLHDGIAELSAQGLRECGSLRLHGIVHGRVGLHGAQQSTTIKTSSPHGLHLRVTRCCQCLRAHSRHSVARVGDT